METIIANDEAGKDRFQCNRWHCANSLLVIRHITVKQCDALVPATVGYEQRDKNVLLEKVMNFGPNKYCVLEEVGVTVATGCAPSVNIDIESCEYLQDKKYVIIVSFSSSGDNIFI